MGWTGTHRDPKTPLADFYAKQFDLLRLVATATVNRGSEFYAVAQEKGTGCFFGLVVIARPMLSSITYKVMEESMGPCYHNCPARLLDMLDKLAPVQPTVNTYDAELTAKIGPRTGAYEWRQQCRQQLAAAAGARSARARIQPGDTVIFDRAFGGSAGSRFVACAHAGKLLFRSAANGRLYNVTPVTMLRSPYTVLAASG